MVEVIYGELVEDRATNFEYNPFADGTVQAFERQESVGLSATSQGNLSGHFEQTSRLPQIGQSNYDYARQQWAQSDERLINDLQRMDADYDRTIRDIDSDAAVARAELEAQRRQLNLPNKNRGNRIERASQVAAGLGAAIDGISAYRERRAGGAGFGESLGAAAGRVGGGLAGTQGGAAVGRGVAVGIQGPGAAEPVSSIGGAAIGGAIGTLAGAAVGGAAGESLGAAIGRGLDRFADWINPLNDGRADPMEDSSEITEGQPIYDPSKPGGVPGGQCQGVLYSVTGSLTYQSNGTYVRDFGYTNVPGKIGFTSVPTGETSSISGPQCEFYVTSNGATSSPGRRIGKYGCNSVLKINSVSRMDGQSDTCGDVPNTVTPDKREPLTKPKFGLPIGLPIFDLPDGVDLPDFTGQPIKGPTETPRFEPIPIPTDPTTFLPRPDPFGETPGDRTRPKPGDDFGNDDEPTETPVTPADSVCDPCAKLDEVLGLLRAEFSNSLVLTPCGEGEMLEQTVTSQGFTGLSATNSMILTGLTKIWDAVKCDTEATAVFPDWWQVRVGNDRPQIVVLYGEINNQGKLLNSRWSLHVPWFDARFRNQLKTLLPKYTKGNWQSLITLQDNSKIIVYGSSKSQAENTARALSRLCIASYRPSPLFIKTSELKGKNLKIAKVVPLRASYFSTGQEKMKPDWVEKIR